MEASVRFTKSVLVDGSDDEIEESVCLSLACKNVHFISHDKVHVYMYIIDMYTCRLYMYVHFGWSFFVQVTRSVS